MGLLDKYKPGKRVVLINKKVRFSNLCSFDKHLVETRVFPRDYLSPLDSLIYRSNKLVKAELTHRKRLAYLPEPISDILLRRRTNNIGYFISPMERHNNMMTQEQIKKVKDEVRKEMEKAMMVMLLGAWDNKTGLITEYAKDN